MGCNPDRLVAHFAGGQVYRVAGVDHVAATVSTDADGRGSRIDGYDGDLVGYDGKLFCTDLRQCRLGALAHGHGRSVDDDPSRTADTNGRRFKGSTAGHLDHVGNADADVTPLGKSFLLTMREICISGSLKRHFVAA